MHLPQAALLSTRSNERVFIGRCRFCSQFGRQVRKDAADETQILIYCKLKQHFILIFPFELAFS